MTAQAGPDLGAPGPAAFEIVKNSFAKIAEEMRVECGLPMAVPRVLFGGETLVHQAIG